MAVVHTEQYVDGAIVLLKTRLQVEISAIDAEINDELSGSVRAPSPARYDRLYIPGSSPVIDPYAGEDNVAEPQIEVAVPQGRISRLSGDRLVGESTNDLVVVASLPAFGDNANLYRIMQRMGRAIIRVFMGQGASVKDAVVLEATYAYAFNPDPALGDRLEPLNGQVIVALTLSDEESLQ